MLRTMKGVGAIVLLAVLITANGEQLVWGAARPIAVVLGIAFICFAYWLEAKRNKPEANRPQS